jgi:EmrB/QacA subfamily drug resistance transporter
VASAYTARRRGLALAVLCAATLMIILDGTIVTVALPSIQRGLGFSPAGLTWVINAYLLAFGGLLLLAGKAGDRVGRKRMFLAGLALFAAASLACGLSTDAAMLIAARFVQGAGGAMVTAVSLGMIAALYDEPHERARAIGAYSFVGAGGASIGLVIGGIITQGLGWHWIFFVNLPIAVVSAAIAARVLARDRVITSGGIDALGAALVTGGLMLAVFAVVSTASHGWTSAATLVPAAIAAALLALFVVRQATAADPLLPLRVLRNREVSAANFVQILVIAAAFGFQVLITLYMQRVLGFSARTSGLGLMPTAAVIGAVSLGLSARLSARFGARIVLLAGLGLILVALLLLTGIPVHGSYPVHLLPAMLVFGAGGGLILPALATLGMSAATEADAGIASGLFNTSQQIGAAVGVALLSAVAAGRAARLLTTGQSTAAALTGGYRLAFLIGAIMSAAALMLALPLLRLPRRAPAGPAPAAAIPAAAIPPPTIPPPTIPPTAIPPAAGPAGEQGGDATPEQTGQPGPVPVIACRR